MSRPLPLATVLRVRDIEEGLARRRLAEAVAEQTRASELRAARHEAYDAAPALTGGSCAVFLAGHARGAALARAARAAEGQEREATAAAGVARDAHTAAAVRLAGLERLADRAREARRRKRLAADQRTAEESAAARRVLEGPR